ncbi:MAG TPA: hypothetical protein VG733_18795, partial [Chthoniobacteraceae bacterium]|nr:hypothetical protein [Chthoniobacteraceae bacterium]
MTGNCRADDFETLVKLLKKGTPPAQVAQASQRLRDAGIDALPTLIAHFKDTTPADKSLAANASKPPTVGEVSFNILQTEIEGNRPAEMRDTYILTPANAASWLKQQKQFNDLIFAASDKTRKAPPISLHDLQQQARQDALYHLWDLEKKSPNNARLKKEDQFVTNEIIAFEGQSNAGAHRFAGTESWSTEFLYVSYRLALLRRVWTDQINHNAQRIQYELLKCHWGGEPSLFGSTGDTSDGELIDDITDLAWVPDKNLLTGKGSTPADFEKAGMDLNPDVPTVYFLLDLATRKLDIYKTQDEFLTARAGDPQDSQQRPVEIEFRLMVHDHDHLLKKPDVPPNPP